jgi:hypothetical protein
MYFKHKETGNVFECTDDVIDFLCAGEGACDSCPIWRETKVIRGVNCFNFAAKNPELLARLAGLEISTTRPAYARAIAPVAKEPVKPDGMNQERFEALVQEIREKSMDTLLKKNANYGNADKLHNFRRGAAIIGCTPAQAALGYMTKHMASLIDKIQNNDFRDRDDFLEKIQDSINYLVFIWCCGNEERDKQEVNDD